MAIGETFWKGWGEIFTVILLIVGFAISISMNNSWFVYIVIFISGLLVGRFYFSKIGKQPLFPFFLIIIGFLFGYVLGSFVADANKKAIVILFFLGWITSHIAHKKGYIPA